MSEFRHGRKGLVCCAARGKPRVEKIFNFYLMVFDHTLMEEATPLLVSGRVTRIISVLLFFFYHAFGLDKEGGMSSSREGLR